mmetsp:Transcript_10673/g.37224  ORF Transcript_10673/g.37224 Transcript_10673/m.37224 type:complete len:200 (-) Transcript_10673:375-974(-)
MRYVGGNDSAPSLKPTNTWLLFISRSSWSERASSSQRWLWMRPTTSLNSLAAVRSHRSENCFSSAPSGESRKVTNSRQRHTVGMRSTASRYSASCALRFSTKRCSRLEPNIFLGGRRGSLAAEPTKDSSILCISKNLEYRTPSCQTLPSLDTSRTYSVNERLFSVLTRVSGMRTRKLDRKDEWSRPPQCAMLRPPRSMR